ncbi:MAG TPA: phosphoribosylformylglycinamidine synthase subunit PurL [bacterium]|nr:phosphoribosylformylglycinamidine synthase subunit PurL [bacterium]
MAAQPQVGCTESADRAPEPTARAGTAMPQNGHAEGGGAKSSSERAVGAGLRPSEYDEIRRRLGREPTSAELGMFGVMWSEHCAYKHSKAVLRRLPACGHGLLRGPGENAGAVSVGGGWAAVFKMESHNHPSAVVPFHGAATGVGGIIRDILAMGARPVALLDSLRFGPPGDAAVARLLDGVIAGIAAYGNSVGVPTVGGELSCAPCYQRNPLVNVACLGLVREDRIATARAGGAGNAVVYLGARTGRDGMQGAAFASAELAGNPGDRSAVQMGDPFTGKLLIEATLEALATGAVVALQDLGAAGLTCALCEMSAKGGVGMHVDLGAVPRREEGMTPEEVLLSESQERMLLVVQAGREAEVLRIAKRWGLAAVVIGHVIDDPTLIVRDGERIVARLDPRHLTEAPEYAPDAVEPAYLREVREFDPAALPPVPAARALETLLHSPAIASKRWVFRQYDHMIQVNTVVVPGADAAVLRLRDAAPRGVALTVDGNSRYCYLDPYVGAMIAVLEAAQNLACVGAAPAAVTDCLNFASPERPEVFWTFQESVEGIARACEAVDVPVVGGNVSFYNEAGVGIYPTPIVAMLGRLDDVRRHAGLGWARDGDLVVVLGSGRPWLDGSEYLAAVHGITAGRLREPDLLAVARTIRCVRETVASGVASSAHDCSDGGIAVALAECCIVGGRGAHVTLAGADERRQRELLFGEGIGRVVLSLRPEALSVLAEVARRFSVVLQVIGTVGGDRLVIDADLTPVGASGRSVDRWLDVDVAALRTAWEPEERGGDTRGGEKGNVTR